MVPLHKGQMGSDCPRGQRSICLESPGRNFCSCLRSFLGRTASSRRSQDCKWEAEGPKLCHFGQETKKNFFLKILCVCVGISGFLANLLSYLTSLHYFFLFYKMGFWASATGCGGPRMTGLCEFSFQHMLRRPNLCCLLSRKHLYPLSHLPSGTWFGPRCWGWRERKKLQTGNEFCTLECSKFALTGS